MVSPKMFSFHRIDFIIVVPPASANEVPNTSPNSYIVAYIYLAVLVCVMSVVIYNFHNAGMFRPIAYAYNVYFKSNLPDQFYKSGSHQAQEYAQVVDDWFAIEDERV